MPRDVVPMRRSPRRASLSRSSSRWYGRMRCALSLTMQTIADVDAGLRQLVDLGEERRRIDHDAVADDAGDARMQDAGRKQPQHELAPVGVHGVTGVVAALIPGHDRKIRRQQIDDLALAFVSPLRSKYC